MHLNYASKPACTGCRNKNNFPGCVWASLGGTIWETAFIDKHIKNPIDNPRITESRKITAERIVAAKIARSNRDSVTVLAANAIENAVDTYLQ